MYVDVCMYVCSIGTHVLRIRHRLLRNKKHIAVGSVNGAKTLVVVSLDFLECSMRAV